MQFKRIVKAKIKLLNKERLIEMVKGKRYKKLDINNLELDNFNRKPYLSKLTIIDARLRFRIASQMVQTVKMNFQSDRAFKEDLWKCTACGKADSQKHLFSCKGYENFRKDKDLSKDKDLVTYFRSIIQERMNNI